MAQSCRPRPVGRHAIHSFSLSDLFDLSWNLSRPGEQSAHDLVGTVRAGLEHQWTATVDHLDAMRTAVGRRVLGDAPAAERTMHPHQADAEFHTFPHGHLRSLRTGAD